ncbi:type II secretion system protein GspD [Prochlorococcus marinus]|uniref:General secretion pathway protein GspD n=1 Tax=Prochlorococcus marinus XMU1408 TaxID=2213228 RepID=A0A318R2E2_PROMR|nr:secretin N-terminal domain-containing protein [Prochlorococcus marinus]PYE01080.1 general secretion pathway protein GspD [Prochlorococcus marinus XMU1408]
MNKRAEIKLILLTLLFATPMAGLANMNKHSLFEAKISNQNQKSATTLISEEKLIKELHDQGAISTKNANEYLKENKRLNLISPDLNNNISPLKELKKEGMFEIAIEEVGSSFNIDFLDKGKISNYKISKFKNGWKIFISFNDNYLINLSNLNKPRKYISKLEVEKINNKSYTFKIYKNRRYKLSKPTIGDKKDPKIEIKATKLRKESKLLVDSPLSYVSNTKSGNNSVKKAIAPPLGNIATGSVVLQNRGFINLNGPNISLTLNNMPAKDALLKLAKMAGYGFILANDNSQNESGKNSFNSKSINNLDQGPKVTLSFVDENYSIAFNSILLASGLQAKLTDDLIIVGENVLGKTFGPQLSKVYRMNQASASSAADFLASLGAKISKVIIASATSSDSVTNSGTTSNSPNTTTLIDSYSATTGPLKGLTGTTDSRLQTLTLVGSPELILIAEKYLKQLDLRQRQVALSVKILDVELSKNEALNNDFAFRTGSTFIVNEQGKLFSAFGNFIPPAISGTLPSIVKTVTNGVSSNKTDSDTSSDTTTTNSSTENSLTTSKTPNPGNSYKPNELYSFLMAKIQDSSTKVLANPTLILSENPEKIVGGQAVVAQSGGGGQASIGRPYANESFVTLGTDVITGFQVNQSDNGAVTCQANFSTSGITFGARVNKIDDNGYVTFSLSPKLTAISEIINIPNCGPVNVLSVRRLDTGMLRVRDSQTLILTGVLSDIEGEVTSKIPLLGDIPIIGRAFRSKSNSSRKSELVIMVTPQIVNDSQINTSGVGYLPKVRETKELIEGK